MDSSYASQKPCPVDSPLFEVRFESSFDGQVTPRPHIFGMTASPLGQKCNSVSACRHFFRQLESNLDAQVHFLVVFPVIPFPLAWQLQVLSVLTQAVVLPMWDLDGNSS